MQILESNPIQLHLSQQRLLIPSHVFLTFLIAAILHLELSKHCTCMRVHYCHASDVHSPVFPNGFEGMASGNGLVVTNYCTCQEYNLVYECTVEGEGATVWRGTAFGCPATNNEIVLYHRTNFTEECNNGMIVGHVIRTVNNHHTSQLTVRVSPEMNGRSIVCAHDNDIGTITIGSSMVTITVGKLY